MIETADVIVVGAGVQGASLAFHLARRGASVVVVERETVAAGATGRSSGFVRMHYDLESDDAAGLGVVPVFPAHGPSRSGPATAGFVRTGFLHVDAGGARAPDARQHRRCSRRSGSRHQRRRSGRDRPSRPGRRHRRHRRRRRTSRESGYADPSGTAAGFLDRRPAARGPARPGQPGALGRGRGRARSAGVDTDRGRIAAPVVVDRGRRLGGGSRPDRRRRAAGPALAPRDGLLRAAGRPRTGLPDRHRRGQRGLLPARGRRPHARRAGGRQRGRRLAGPVARHCGSRPPSRTWSGGSARASPG